MTEDNKFIKGSEWCKWDLHIHSNASDGNSTPKEIIVKAKELNLSVIALTDHHTAKNIDEIKSEGLKEGIVVISGIEFRTTYGDKSVHLIGLFPDIYNNIELNSNNLHQLILCPLDLSEISIISKGKENNSSLSDEEAFKKGMFLVQVEFKKASDLIHKYGGLVTVHAGSKNNGIEKEIKHTGTSLKNVKSISDCLGPLKEELFKQNYIDICEISKENDSEKFYLDSFNKVSITASDAHKLSEIGSKSVWIKANPTFEGLRQVSNENSRIYLGEVPPLIKRVKENQQRYIKKLSFKKLGTPILNETWFDNIELELNPGLVAIIGNKGMGKSALADTIGLLGDTPNYKDFSFLNEKKFKQNKPNRALSFQATLIWESGLLSATKLLSDIPHEQAIEKVKYLPQGYLEKLCNDNHSHFLKELRNVIFTYIPENKRFGKTNLTDLEQFTSDSIKKEISQIINDIDIVNQKIIYFEKKENDSYKAQIESSLKQKKIDFEAHKLTEPSFLDLPSNKEQIEEKNVVDENIRTKKQEIEKLEEQLTENKRRLSQISLTRVNLEKALSSLTILENEFNKTLERINPVLLENDIQIADIINLTINRDILISKIELMNDQINNLDMLVNPELYGGIPFKILEQKKQLLELQITLDESSRIYQKYLSDKETWERTKKAILGDINQVGTIKYFENELYYIETMLENDISKEIEKRNVLLKNLFSKKMEILNSFKTFYQPITNFFTKEGEILNEYEIKLDVENKLIGFEDKFLTQINSSAKGSFYGTEDARRKLIEIVQNIKWESEDDVILFLNTIIDNLKFDRRSNNGDKREVDRQLKNGYSIENFYNFLFSLDYIEPNYKLKLNEKNIEELSPGERGALLLIFYLALDQNDIPLIIDQPEENLDNQSVYNLLAQYIKSAKEKRQVIIVTHNPNLAVVCDADQIVHVKIEKHNKNKVIINSGALEDPIINKTVVDILEGTYEAFDTRDTKYKVIPRKY